MNNDNNNIIKCGGISYVHGSSEIPLLHDTVADRLRLAVEHVPNRTMVIFPELGVRKTYQQVFTDARQLAASLIHLKLKKGDRIGIWSPNCYEWIMTKYAAALSGLVIVGINSEYKADELKYVLQKVGVSAIVSPSIDSTNNYYQILAKIVPEILDGKLGCGKIESKDLPNLKNIVMFGADKNLKGVWNFDEILKLPGSKDFELLDQYESQIRVDDPFNIIFTSGTTGRPKAATLTHHNVVNNTYFIGLRANFKLADEIFCVPLPLFGGGAFIFGSLCSLCHQGTIVFPARNATNVLEDIQNEKATLLYGVPTMLIAILNHPDLKTFDLSSLHGGVIGGAATPGTICQKIVKHLGMKNYVDCYGATEMTLTAVSYPNDQRIVKPLHIMPHIEMAIINKNGNFVNLGEKGEIIVRGYSIMQGYWNDEEKTKEVFGKDRWYHTGDIGSMNPDGSVEICGRYKDVIIRGGFNYYPAEIEQFIIQHPFIADVCVVGVPDKIHGEEVCAWIRLKPNTSLSPQELIGFLEDKISTSKIPRYFFFKSHHEFPQTANGKIKKYELQNLSIKELNLENVTSYCET